MIVQFKNLHPRVTAEQLIAESQQKEHDFVLNALQRHFRRERAMYRMHQWAKWLTYGAIAGITLGFCVMRILGK